MTPSDIAKIEARLKAATPVADNRSIVTYQSGFV
jgi:hypothetical protein